jgi:hypothetical protein
MLALTSPGWLFASVLGVFGTLAAFHGRPPALSSVVAETAAGEQPEAQLLQQQTFSPAAGLQEQAAAAAAAAEAEADMSPQQEQHGKRRR